MFSQGQEPVVVLKIGGSVLSDAASYRRVAEALRRRLAADRAQRFVVVVSAENGLTDALLQTARACIARPNPVMLDLLWSTGELRSVALLVFSLHAAGIRSIGLNAHQTGLLLPSPSSGTGIEFDPRRIRRALERYRVAVVPGFLARRRSDAIVTLGRGSSDLTAVLLASGLGAACELVKDVPGYFTADPAKHPDATHIPALSIAAAITLAAGGCDLVQQAALETAQQRGISLVIRSLTDGAPHTVIEAGEARTKDGAHPAPFDLPEEQVSAAALPQVSIAGESTFVWATGRTK